LSIAIWRPLVASLSSSEELVALVFSVA